MSILPVNGLSVADQLVAVLTDEVVLVHTAQVMPLHPLGVVGVVSHGHASLVPRDVAEGPVVRLGNAGQASVRPTGKQKRINYGSSGIYILQLLTRGNTSPVR